ncbi:MAG TPA: DEAD/DEAH box helicase [Pseudogracilibacillus sp.]|nr:DEAD/DEAH box helicase [Pseudogracilibacillus sp.]
MIKSKNDALILEAELAELQSELAVYDEAYFNQIIANNWQDLKRKAMIEHLKLMPMASLSTLESGIPINWLVASGHETIYDIHDLTKEQLMTIDGIGVVFAEAIYTAVKKIKKSVQKDVLAKIDPDQAGPEELALLQSVYKKRYLSKEIVALQADLKKFLRRINRDIELAKKQRNFFFRLFQPKQELEEIKEAFANLNTSFVQEAYATIKENFNHVRKFSLDDSALLEHYIEENIAYYVEIENVIGVDPSKTTDDLPSEIIEEINEFPINMEGLELEFRSYQLFGAKYALHFKRTLLGDEMGLGKTVQALGLINHLYQAGKGYSMVVAPLSILSNWQREIKKFSAIPVFIFHGSQRDNEFMKWQDKSGVLLTTYEHTAHLKMEDQALQALIVDEAHYVKNPEARRSQNVYHLSGRAEYALFMSGTPLENNVEEMKQLVTVLNNEVGRRLSEHLYLLEPRKFKETIQEVYLRRNRSDVLEELPELEEKREWVPFGRSELTVYYRAVEEGQLMLMRRAAWLGGGPEQSPKLKRLLEICDNAEANGHKVLVFSFFKDVLKVVHKHLKGRSFDVISGDISNQRRQEIIDEFTKAKKGSVLISQITAGGVGLNIQAANIVILCEPQWKPSIENQAISRAYRMGQSRKVLVYRLLTEESIDESMLEVLGQKAALFDLYARESVITDVTSPDLDENITKQVLEMEKERVEKQVAKL